MNLMMDGDGNFGASTGFPLPGVDVQVESKFRVKFKETATLGDHSFTAKLMVVDGTTVTDEMVCETTATFTLVGTSVNPPIEGASTLTTDIDGDAIALDTWHEFTFTLNGSAEDAGKKVVGVSQFSDVDIIDALEYWEVADNSWKNLLLDTDGAFGAAEGFDMPAVDFEATSKFRVKFKHPDTIKDSYSFVVQMHQLLQYYPVKLPLQCFCSKKHRLLLRPYTHLLYLKQYKTLNYQNILPKQPFLCY